MSETNRQQTGSILVYCEASDSGAPEPTSLEAIGIAFEAAQPMGLEVIAVAPRAAAGEIAKYPLARICIPRTEPHGKYCPEWHVAFAEQASRLCNPVAIFFAHSQLGQDIAPRLALKLDAGLVTDVVAIAFDNKKLLASKAVQGGIATATYAINTLPQLLTLRARAGKILAKDESNHTNIVELDVPADACALAWEFVERVKEESAEIKLEDADVVVSGGRGIGGPEGFELIRETAKELRAAVGSSRPPCDSGWISSSYQVGITGKIISPRVYIAVGISGASQHLSGMGDSKTIVAINKDPESFIFQAADYGAVGDYRQVLPAFIRTIRELKK